MAKVRWGRSALEEPFVAPTPKVRWGRSALTGTVVVVPKVRWGRSALSGTPAVVLVPLSNQTVEPETVVTVTAALVGGGSADSYTFRRISGAAISFLGSGASRSFYAPSALPPGTSVTIGVVATIGGVNSVEQTCVITVLPQIRWALSGSTWVGQRPSVPM
jgi:hypothetical protein